MILTYLHIKKIKYHESSLYTKLIIVFILSIVVVSGCGTPIKKATPAVTPAPTAVIENPTQVNNPTPELETTPSAQLIPSKPGNPRGYLTTPQELHLIAQKAQQGMEPYRTYVSELMNWANQDWDFKLKAKENCPGPNKPAWIDNDGGIPILYAKALAYHLTGNVHYAEQVKTILERIMTEVLTININTEECRLVFGWGTPELVASADLIEEYWSDQTCTGPTGTLFTDTQIGTGNCKRLFQNWLVKNPYYIVSYTAESSKSNWGAAATNTTAYIADYLWDRSDVFLLERNPPEINNGKDVKLTPSQAFKHANQLAIDRMDGYGVELRSSTSCDYLSGFQQNPQWTPVKSQISEKGIIPEDARRQEYCNIPQYNGTYENYPQVHLGNNIQQCELMLRRGDSSCYDNVDTSDIPDYKFIGPDGQQKVTHLYPGRGSIERAIKAIIVDSSTEWRHDSALAVAYRYYYTHHTLSGFEQWAPQIIGKQLTCSQDICFGGLTHGFAIGQETPDPVYAITPP